jgi:hypothetical protein
VIDNSSANTDRWLRSVNAEHAEEVQRLRSELSDLRKLYTDTCRDLGYAEWLLSASEFPGLLDGWRERAEKAEAERDRMREALRGILTEILHSLDGRTEPVHPLTGQWVAEQARKGLQFLAALASAGEEEVARLRAENKRLLGYKLDSDDTAQRLEDAQAYCQKHAPARTLGRNVWHVILDDAIRMRALRTPPAPELEPLVPTAMVIAAQILCGLQPQMDSRERYGYGKKLFDWIAQQQSAEDEEREP